MIFHKILNLLSIAVSCNLAIAWNKKRIMVNEPTLKRTISVNEGGIKCLPCNEEELKEKLKSKGGYVSGFVATTEEEAKETFENLVEEKPRIQKGLGNEGPGNEVPEDRDRKRNALNQRQCKRTMRNSDGSITKINHCYRKGKKASTGNLRLCDVYTASRELTADRFPRFINEVLCRGNHMYSSSNYDQNRQKCLSGEGECAQTLISLTLLKKATTCSLRRNQTGSYYFQDWTEYHQNIGVGCNCELKPHSRLAKTMI